MDTLSVLSYILAVISVITVIVTIRQNNRMLESTSRPYVSIYFDYTNMGEPIGYFVIKNFGNSSAKITKLTYNHIVKNQPKSLCKVSDILDDMAGNTISPGQKIIMPIKVSNSPKGTCFFEITYVSSTKEYRDFFEITVSHYGKLSKSRIKNNETDHLISYPLQEIAERLM